MAFSVVIAAVGIACVSNPPPPEAPAVEVIPLAPSGSHPISFLHVIERIPAGTILGEARWKRGGVVFEEFRANGNSARSKTYNVAITDLLRTHGYTVLDEADAVFETGREVRVRYALAGVIHEWNIEYIYDKPRRWGAAPKGSSTATVKFELQIYDAVLKETIFQHTYRGTGADEGSEPNAMVPAIINAVSNALADPGFVAAVAVTEKASTIGSTDSQPTTTVSKCHMKSAVLPAGIGETLKSVVVVQVGGLSGGGVIVSGDGHVRTAEHVIGDSEEVFVRLHSGPMIPARVVSRSSYRDLALLKLPGHGYRCAPVTNSAALTVGSEIYTINIFVDERTPTVSRGIVSGYQQIDNRRYIQTDASINPGSSGGPIFDQTGSVGGIVTEKVIGLGIEGLGLGVPIEEAEHSLHFTWE